MAGVTLSPDQLMLRLQLADLCRHTGHLLRELGLSADLQQALAELHSGARAGHAGGTSPFPGETALPRALLARLHDFHVLQETVARTPPERLHYAQLEQATEVGQRAVEGLELELARRGIFPAVGFVSEVARAQMESAHHQAHRASLAALSLLDQILAEPADRTAPCPQEARERGTAAPPQQPMPGLLSLALRRAVRLPPVWTTPLTLPPLPPVTLPEVLTAPVTLPPGLARLIDSFGGRAEAESRQEEEG